MKKTYLKPEMEIVKINVNQQILAGSAPTLGEDFTDGDPVLAPSDEDIIFGNSGFSFDFWITHYKTQNRVHHGWVRFFCLLAGLETDKLKINLKKNAKHYSSIHYLR